MAGNTWNRVTTHSPLMPEDSAKRIGAHNTPQIADDRKTINKA
jgi:hypothetical protein